VSVLHVPDFDAAIPSAESGPTPDTGLVGVRALADMLAGVPDPRKVRGIRHQIGAARTVMVCAVLAGARNSGKPPTVRPNSRPTCWV
jgi:hypothetical protein